MPDNYQEWKEKTTKTPVKLYDEDGNRLYDQEKPIDHLKSQ